MRNPRIGIEACDRRLPEYAPYAPVEREGTTKPVTPRPLYFDPDEPAMCSACLNGGVCMCVMYTRIT